MIKNNTWSEPSMRIALSKTEDRDDNNNNGYSNAPQTASERLHDPLTNSLAQSQSQSHLPAIPIIDTAASPPPPHTRSYQSRPDHAEPPPKRARLSDDEGDEPAPVPIPMPMSGAHTTLTTAMTVGQQHLPLSPGMGSGSYNLGSSESMRKSQNKDIPGSNSPSIDITTSSALTRPTRTSLRIRQPEPEPEPQHQTHAQTPQQADLRPASISISGAGNALHDVDMQSGNDGGNGELTTTSTSGGELGVGGGGEISGRKIRGGGGGGAAAGGDDGERKTKVKDKSYINRQNVVGGEKRSLRSHDGGSRSKSELAMYFSNYEQVVGLEPVKREFLCADTTISVINDLTEPVQLDQPHDTTANESRNPLINLHNAQIIDLSPPEPSTTASASASRPQRQKQTQQPASTDPLDDAHYFKPHRRLERQEKQLRNIEKERAQHEKGQLEHLLDELQGHDWLRVMGISGVTDSDKKLYLPKRDYFIGEVTSLLGKFKAWKKAKGLRLWEKGRRSSIVKGGKAGDEESGEEEGAEEGEGDDEAGGLRRDMSSGKHRRSDENNSTSVVPDADDVDAWAARQLHQEALSASENDRLQTHPHPHPHSSTHHTMQPPPPPSSSTPLSPSKQHAPAPHHPTIPALWSNKPFTSFYSKPHLRQAALKRDKRSRTHVAFGEPVPEVAQEDFQLPDSILTPEAIRAAQRRNRRLRREIGKKS